MPRLSYRALRAFVETADAGTVAAASRRLGVTASAVSHLIRELERSTGSKLLTPGARPVLTAAGARLREGLAGAFSTIDQALSSTIHAEAAVRISTTATFANLWLLPRLPGFCSSHPEVTVTLDATRRVVGLRDEPIDCAIRWGRGAWDASETHLLFREVLVAVGAGPRLDPSTWRVAAASRPGDWGRFSEGAGIDIETRPHVTCHDRAGALAVVEGGLGATVVDEVLAGHAMRAGRIVVVHPARVALEDGFHLVISDRGSRNWAALAFREWLLSEAPTVGESRTG
jgi:LysR family transcriptional regulator, glycine cleavage system transcriptional activator